MKKTDFAENSFFYASDGTKIEIGFYESKFAKFTLLFTPCMRGNFRQYRIPKNDLLTHGYNFLGFNPRGHGNSEGVFSFDKIINDLEVFIREYNSLYPNIPLVGLGHSGGGTALIRLSESIEMAKSFKMIYLASPILDTRESLFFLYGHNRIQEFYKAVLDSTRANQELENLLSSPQWLEINYWNKENWKDKLNLEYSKSRSPQNQIGEFLENLFIPGHNVKNLLLSNSVEFRIFLPSRDDWYPMEETKRVAFKFNLPITTIESAEDHFFRNGWSDLWREVMNRK